MILLVGLSLKRQSQLQQMTVLIFFFFFFFSEKTSLDISCADCQNLFSLKNDFFFFLLFFQNVVCYKVCLVL